MQCPQHLHSSCLMGWVDRDCSPAGRAAGGLWPASLAFNRTCELKTYWDFFKLILFLF